MSDTYGSGLGAGQTGQSPSTDGGILYDLGYIEGKRARERRDGPAGAGIGVLALSFMLCWLYPMVGASVSVVGLMFYLGADTFPRSVLFLILLLAIPAWFLGFTLERRISRFRAYRVVRDCIRCAVGLYPWVYALGAPADASSGGTLAVYPFLFAGGFLLVKRADRVLGFRG